MNKLLIGFTAGLLIGILLAPDKGSETRQRVNRKAKDLQDKFDDLVDSFTSETVIVTGTIEENVNPYAKGDSV